MHASFGKQYSIKATQIEVMQFTTRQYQTGNFIIQFHNTQNLTRYFFLNMFYKLEMGNDEIL